MIVQCIALAAGILIGRARVHEAFCIVGAVLTSSVAAAILLTLGARWFFESIQPIAMQAAVYADGLPPTVLGSAPIGVALVVFGIVYGRRIIRR